MTFYLKLTCDNTSFGEHPEERASEIASILRVACERLERGQTESSLFDSNGNKVGEFHLADE